MNIPQDANSIQINLYGINGEMVDNIYSSNTIKSGKNSFSFNTNRLINGTYLVKVMLDGKLFESQTVVKM